MTHGTAYAYKRGCHCHECRAAIHRQNCRRYGFQVNPDELPCECWCGRSVVGVTPSMVRAGLTASCGDPRCKA